MAASVDENKLLDEFSNFTPDPPHMRDMCWRCSRPAVTCWCSHLPEPPIDTSTTIIILQHPYEEGRRLKTAPMLQHGLAKGRCHVFVGKRFPLAKYPLLAAAMNEPDRCLLMFPSDSAVDLDSVLEKQVSEEQENQCTGYTLVLLDGTWFQARGIYGKNQYLRTLKQVKLSNTGLSEYVIRTQPNDASLSTLECAAIALSKLEGNPLIKERLVAPLRALCRYQMEYGAVTHHSKQYLIEHGLYQKQVSKLQLRKFIETGGSKVRTKEERECLQAAGSTTLTAHDLAESGEEPTAHTDEAESEKDLKVAGRDAIEPIDHKFDLSEDSINTPRDTATDLCKETVCGLENEQKLASQSENTHLERLLVNTLSKS